MSQRAAHVDKVWRRTKLFFYIWPFWCAMIIGINIRSDASAGRPFNYTNLFLGITVLAGGGIVFVACWLVLKFVRGVFDVTDRRP